MSCEPAAVAWARGWALEELTSSYAAAGEFAYDVQVVVSELVTNALQANCQRLTIALEAHHSYLRVATIDDAPGYPVKQHPGPRFGHGRGLLVVEALSKRWGVETHKQGKTVWAELAPTTDPGPTFDCKN